MSSLRDLESLADIINKDKGSPQADHDDSATPKKKAKTANKNKGEKTQEAKEREELIISNAEKHASIDEDKLKEMLPKDAEGNPTSIGAILHASEKCQPCSFFHYSLKGCQNGIHCKYCHADHPKSKKGKKRPQAADGSADGMADNSQKKQRPQLHPAATGSKRARVGKGKGKEGPGPELDGGNSRPSWLAVEDVKPPPHVVPPPNRSPPGQWPYPPHPDPGYRYPGAPPPYGPGPPPHMSSYGYPGGPNYPPLGPPPTAHGHGPYGGHHGARYGPPALHPGPGGYGSPPPHPQYQYGSQHGPPPPGYHQSGPPPPDYRGYRPGPGPPPPASTYGSGDHYGPRRPEH